MITREFKTREEWLNARIGRITGSKVSEILTKKGNSIKKGVYQLIADRIAVKDVSGLTPLERGVQFEKDAIERFTTETGIEVDTRLLMWFRDDDESIAYSPDGVISDEEAVEVKCLSSANHVEAMITRKVPKEYEDQIIQAFVVNEKLKKIYMVFFDPRMTVNDFFYIEVLRDDKKVAKYIEEEKKVMEYVDKIVNSLIKF